MFVLEMEAQYLYLAWIRSRESDLCQIDFNKELLSRDLAAPPGRSIQTADQSIKLLNSAGGEVVMSKFGVSWNTKCQIKEKNFCRVNLHFGTISTLPLL